MTNRRDIDSPLRILRGAVLLLLLFVVCTTVKLRSAAALAEMRGFRDGRGGCGIGAHSLFALDPNACDLCTGDWQTEGCMDRPVPKSNIENQIDEPIDCICFAEGECTPQNGTCTGRLTGWRITCYMGRACCKMAGPNLNCYSGYSLTSDCCCCSYQPPDCMECSGVDECFPPFCGQMSSQCAPCLACAQT